MKNLPLGLTVSRCCPWRESVVSRTAEEAIEIAYGRLDEELLARSDLMELLQKSISTEVTDQSVVLTCRLVCIRDIAEQREFEVIP